MDPISPPPVVVASFRSLPEAHVARSAIESAGIEVVLSNQHGAGADRFHADVLGGIGVVVAAEDADRALAALDGLWPEPAETPGQTQLVWEAERCPECRSSAILTIRRLPFFLLFAVLMMAAGVAVGQRDLFALVVGIVAVLLLIGPNRRCLDCGERWQSWSGRQPLPEEPPVELPDVVCPRCGSTDTGRISRRRMKAGTLLVNFILPPLLLIWPFLPSRKCEECGHEWR